MHIFALTMEKDSLWPYFKFYILIEKNEVKGVTSKVAEYATIQFSFLQKSQLEESPP